MPRSFDLLARPYQFLEKLCFGNTLQRSRTHFINTLPRNPLKVLILGDGDGRFSCELLKQRPLAQIDSIDLSRSMLEIATQRIQREHPEKQNNVHPIHTNALTHNYPTAHYDLVVLNYILDCFNTPQANSLLTQTTQALNENGILIYTDFSIPSKQPQKTCATLLLKTLYTAFKLTTNLPTQKLPTLTWPQDLTPTNQRTFLKGIITTKRLRKRQLT